MSSSDSAHLFIFPHSEACFAFQIVLALRSSLVHKDLAHNMGVD